MVEEFVAEECVVLRNAASGKWLRFNAPFQVITTNEINNVLPALRCIEELVRGHRWHAAGFLSYEASSAFDRALRTHPAGNFPLLWFGLYEKAEEVQLPEPDFKEYCLGELVPTVSQLEYGQIIRRIKEYIRCGDTYQVNYTLRLRSSFTGNAWHLFLSMVRAQPSGYAAFINTGRLAICSASPELFFRLDGNHLTCKPMKGTVKRGRTLDEDVSLSQWLHASDKNRAENLMIVDMIRNDLGRVAEVGSVRVPSLFDVEKHPTLWQMTSTVISECSKSLVDILSALFPCASITGAPKIRTAQIIKELERDPRHLYTGSIGYISPDSFAQFNVAIRTAVVDRISHQVEYGAGGGIVVDSDADDEYTEALLKARVLTEQRSDFSLLETLRWTPEENYYLLEYHLRRLADSAVYFEYPLDIERVKRRLHSKAESYNGLPHRVRLLIHQNGAEEIQAAPLSVMEPASPIRVKMASRPIQSSEVFLYHKTTNRWIYEEALHNSSDCEDVLLYNERGELTESCIANIVVELEGDLFTPAIESGLLAGTFRAYLLEQGKIREKVLYPKDLERCSKIYLVNSVRQWQSAILA
jgi:para-aminobenzoate synthetase/4-amino-4-deoxychorismate lyase